VRRCFMIQCWGPKKVNPWFTEEKRTKETQKKTPSKKGSCPKKQRSARTIKRGMSIAINNRGRGEDKAKEMNGGGKVRKKDVERYDAMIERFLLRGLEIEQRGKTERGGLAHPYQKGHLKRPGKLAQGGSRRETGFRRKENRAGGKGKNK